MGCTLAANDPRSWENALQTNPHTYTSSLMKSLAPRLYYWMVMLLRSILILCFGGGSVWITGGSAVSPASPSLKDECLEKTAHDDTQIINHISRATAFLSCRRSTCPDAYSEAAIVWWVPRHQYEIPNVIFVVAFSHRLTDCVHVEYECMSKSHVFQLLPALDNSSHRRAPPTPMSGHRSTNKLLSEPYAVCRMPSSHKGRQCVNGLARRKVM